MPVDHQHDIALPDGNQDSQLPVWNSSGGNRESRALGKASQRRQLQSESSSSLSEVASSMKRFAQISEDVENCRVVAMERRARAKEGETRK